jgi:hypothetical protein
MDNPVTIRTYTYPTDAAIMRSRLESEGIECFLKNELSIQINPLYSNALGGVELQVDETDLDRAQEILLGLEGAKHSVAEEDKAGEITCPVCGALQSYRKTYSVLIFVLCILCLGIPFFYLGRKHICYSCGNRLP